MQRLEKVWVRKLQSTWQDLSVERQIPTVLGLIWPWFRDADPKTGPVTYYIKIGSDTGQALETCVAQNKIYELMAKLLPACVLGVNSYQRSVLAWADKSWIESRNSVGGALYSKGPVNVDKDQQLQTYQNEIMHLLMHCLLIVAYRVELLYYIWLPAREFSKVWDWLYFSIYDDLIYQMQLYYWCT